MLERTHIMQLRIYAHVHSVNTGAMHVRVHWYAGNAASVRLQRALDTIGPAHTGSSVAREDTGTKKLGDACEVRVYACIHACAPAAHAPAAHMCIHAITHTLV